MSEKYGIDMANNGYNTLDTTGMSTAAAQAAQAAFNWVKSQQNK